MAVDGPVHRPNKEPFRTECLMDHVSRSAMINFEGILTVYNDLNSRVGDIHQDRRCLERNEVILFEIRTSKEEFRLARPRTSEPLRPSSLLVGPDEFIGEASACPTWNVTSRRIQPKTHSAVTQNGDIVANHAAAVLVCIS